MTRVFKTRYFQRWMRKTEVTDAALCKAVEEMTAGLIDADLGGDLIDTDGVIPALAESARRDQLLLPPVGSKRAL